MYTTTVNGVEQPMIIHHIVEGYDPLPVLESNISVDTSVMTISEAMSVYTKDLVESAVNKEMLNMVEKGVFKRVSLKESSSIPKDLIIPSKLFLKDKGNKELKARFVGGGHRQCEKIYERKSSPTVGAATIFIVVVDAAHKNKVVAVLDVPCAYLHASRDGLPKVYIRLAKDLVKIFLKLQPDYASCVHSDGSLIVESIKGLYGLIESSFTWYNHFAKFLGELGFKCCDGDLCLFKNDQDVLIALYVDDLLITGEATLVRDTCNKIQQRFGDCKLKIGKSFNYLGMTFDIQNGKVGVKIDFEKLLVNINKSCDTPAPGHLLTQSGNDHLLNDMHKEKFHSTVAKLLYIAKRTRPDILLPVNFLCTRVQHPNMGDYLKLVRVLRYLYGTSDESLVLTMNEATNETITLHVYIDAAYGVHDDMKSHSGMVISLGEGALLAMSTKQKCISKSSTEAELIAVTDLLPEAFHLKKIVEAITGKKVRIILYQDNMATISMIKNGVGGGRSKHIKIRFGWLKERLDDGDFEVEHKPTKLMLADGATKPKQGMEFESFKIGVGVKLHNQDTKERVGKSKILVVLDEDAFSNIDEFHDGSENMNEDDVSDESTDVAEEDWAGLD